MKFTIDINSLPVKEQEALYLYLKRKFETETSVRKSLLEKHILCDYKNDKINITTLNILNGMGIIKVGDLYTLQKSKLRSITGIGPIKLKWIEDYLKSYNIPFADEADTPT